MELEAEFEFGSWLGGDDYILHHALLKKENAKVPLTNVTQ